ncbi:MAG: hypothetical protein P8Z00_16505 [Anaerolineales bacterium]|jgi:hypothetical protein
MNKCRKGFLFIVGLMSITIEETRKAKEKALKIKRQPVKPMEEAKRGETI